LRERDRDRDRDREQNSSFHPFYIHPYNFIIFLIYTLNNNPQNFIYFFSLLHISSLLHPLVFLLLTYFAFFFRYSPITFFFLHLLDMHNIKGDKKTHRAIRSLSILPFFDTTKKKLFLYPLLLLIAFVCSITLRYNYTIADLLIEIIIGITNSLFPHRQRLMN
jgi:hypothetical protein